MTEEASIPQRAPVITRPQAIALLDRLHAAQNAFYAGRGGSRPFAAILAPGIRWTVPGSNAIAGVYHGHDEVLGYFERRRDVAANSFRLHRRDVLVGHGARIAALVDGTAVLGGRERAWSTVGLYDIVDARVQACSLVPLDQRAFDEIWQRPG